MPLDDSARITPQIDAAAWRKKGNECARLGHRQGYTEALDCYTKGIDVSRACGELGRPLGRLLSCRAHVRLLLGGRDQAEAGLADCKDALAADPTDGKTFWRAAKASHGLGLREQAISFCREGITATGGASSDLQLFLQELTRNSNDDTRDISCTHQFCLQEGGISQFRAEAIASCRDAVAINPNDADALCNLGVALDQADDDEGAVAAFLDAVRVDPKHVAAQRNLGEALRRTGDLSGAVAAFKEALRLAPDEADVATFFGLGFACGKLGDDVQAAEYFRAALALDPTNADAHLGLGIASDHLQDFPSALGSFRAAAKAAPRNAAAWYNVGVAIEREAQAPEHQRVVIGESNATSDLLFEAEVALHTACALEPENPDFHCQLGVVLMRSGKLVQARSSFNAALEAAPSHDGALSNLALLSETSGEDDQKQTGEKSADTGNMCSTQCDPALLSDLLDGRSDVML